MNSLTSTHLHVLLNSNTQTSHTPTSRSGCFPRHAVVRRGDPLAERSPRRRATQLPSTFPQKANFFRNFAPPFPYTHLRNGNDMPLRSALTQTGTTCTATHVARPFPLA